MVVGKRGDLGKMAHAKDLPFTRDRLHFFANGLSRRPAYTGINLIKNAEVDWIHLEQHTLDAKKDPGQLAARRDLVKGVGLFARVGAKRENHLVCAMCPQAMVRANSGGGRQAQFGEGQGVNLDVQPGLRHFEILELGRDLLLAKRWVHKLTGSFSRGDDDAIQPGFTFEAGSARRRVTYATRYSFETGAGLPVKHALSGLAEREWEHFDTSNTFAPAAINRARTMNSVAAEYSGAIAEALFLKGAVRHDDSSTFGTFTTWSASAAYKLASLGSRLHASAGTGVVFPTMFEQFGEFPGFFTPNPDLLPETSFGWDVGLEQKLFSGALVVDATYFEQDLDQEIFSTFSGPPRNLTGTSLRKGIELTARVRPMEGLEILASYTYLDAKEPDGTEEIRRPKHKASLEALYRFNEGKGTLGVGVIYNGRMKDVTTDAFTFAAGRATLDDYTLLRLTGQYKVTDIVEVFGRVENVLDQDYREIFGIATPGLAAYAGVRLRFEGSDAATSAR